MPEASRPGQLTLDQQHEPLQTSQLDPVIGHPEAQTQRKPRPGLQHRTNRLTEGNPYLSLDLWTAQLEIHQSEQIRDILDSLLEAQATKVTPNQERQLAGVGPMSL